MALATRCPHCQTAFRVASDQLKLRAGLVRCGTCKEIFNGIENLLHPDEDIVAATAAPTPPIPTVQESVIASRHVRGDETRYRDLIAEVDRPGALTMPAMPPTAPGAPPADPGAADDLPRDTDDAVSDIDSARLWEALDGQFGVDPADKEKPANSADTADIANQNTHHADAGPGTDAGHAETDRQPPDLRDARSIPAAEPRPLPHEALAADADDGIVHDDALPAHAAHADHAAHAAHADHAAFVHDAERDDPALPTLPSLLRTAAAAGEEAAGVDAPQSGAGLLPAAATGRKRKPTAAMPASVSPPAQSLGELADRLPDFVTREEEREDLHRSLRPRLIAAAVVLALGLLVQGIYAGRTALAAAFPVVRPVLEQACKLVGCSVGLPMQIDSVSIESSDFQPVPGRPDQFLLTVLLRNRSNTVQAWPTIELTLNDTTDKAVGRRLIAPRDYLPAGQTGIKGFSAGSEQGVRLVFDLSRLKASGYRVYVFYP